MDTETQPVKKKFGWKKFILGTIPFIIGLLIGAGLTGNKYVAFILIAYLIGSFIFTMISDKVVKVKQATDKADALQEVGKQTLEGIKDYNEKGIVKGFLLFDKFYQKWNVILFLIEFGFLGLGIYYCFTIGWTNLVLVLLMVFLINVHILLNQIYRMVKYQEEAKEGIPV